MSDQKSPLSMWERVYVGLVAYAVFVGFFAFLGSAVLVYWYYLSIHKYGWDDHGNYTIQPKGFWHTVGVGALWGAGAAVLMIVWSVVGGKRRRRADDRGK
jgi:ABC-type Fe3+ transport system permease subunit